MEQTPDMSKLMSDLFTLQTRLDYTRDEAKKEEILAQIEELRNQMVEIRIEELTKGNNEEERVMSDGKF